MSFSRPLLCPYYSTKYTLGNTATKPPYVPPCQWACGMSLIARSIITWFLLLSGSYSENRTAAAWSRLGQHPAQVSPCSEQHCHYPQGQAHYSGMLRAEDFWQSCENRTRLIEVHTHSSPRKQLPGSLSSLEKKKKNGERWKTKSNGGQTGDRSKAMLS